jgi:sugar O-acyltransferase (sialic acid O-acetyltransferase NeuD family)
MNPKKNVWLIGGGGHALVCADIISNCHQWSIHGVVDPAQQGAAFLTWQVQGEQDIPALLSETSDCVLAIGQVRAGLQRKAVLQRYQSLGASFPALVSPRAYVSAYAGLGDAVMVGHGAVVQPLASLSQGVIVNTSAIVEHGSVIGAFSHVSTRAVINGDCRIGDGVLIGSGAVVLQGKSICDGATVGAGSVVTRHITEPGVYVGVPARKVD